MATGALLSMWCHKSEGPNCEQDWRVTARSGHKTRWKQNESASTSSSCKSDDERRNSVGATSVCDARIPEICCVSALFV